MASLPVDGFLRAAVVPRRQSHAAGTLEAAEAIRAAHPAVARAGIHAAAVLGDEPAVRRFLAAEPALATALGGPYGWDALTHLCFSNYLKLDAARSAGFVGAATALLDAGADPRTGFHERDHQPRPTFECVLYGAAGVAHHAPLTRLLVERGADVNDDEVCYHVPETRDNDALKALVETGRVSRENLVMMLVRKHDWHDYEGVKYLLERGADPNGAPGRDWNPLHHAIKRDNDLPLIALELDHGADPSVRHGGRSAAALAARRGRGDVLAELERRGLGVALEGADRLIAACARGEAAAARAIAGSDPDAVRAVLAEGGTLLAEFAGCWNTEGCALLLDLGVPVTARYGGDGYFGIAPDSTALHVAAWKAPASTVRLLIARGADVHARDGWGRTPLVLAVKACVDSYWTEYRKPDGVRALLEAGATVAGVAYPCGYDAVDALLAPFFT